MFFLYVFNFYLSAKGCWEAQGHLKHFRQDGGSSVASFSFWIILLTQPPTLISLG